MDIILLDSINVSMEDVYFIMLAGWEDFGKV